ncbi:MAG TPA: AAA family ATPase [Actinomycetota bacterium]|nr:AAA family ATPase [Actinomycetota bacterium]
MSGGPAPDGPIAERVRLGRVLAEYGVALSRLATEISTGTTVVLKELPAGEVRTLPPADPRRSVWTRLVLPTQIEVDRGAIRILRPYVLGDTFDASVRGSSSTLERTLVIVLDVLRALDTLHALGSMHGAVKPSNVIVGPDDRGWLVDPAPTDPAADVRRRPRAASGTRSSASMDAARYLSPERAGVLEGPIDARSDLYSVGVLLFESLTGRPLHGARDTGELFRAQVMGAASSIRASGITAPRALDDVVGRLLQKDPRDRYATAAGVLQDLLEIERGFARGDLDPPLVIGLGDQRTTLTEPGFVGRADEIARIDAAIAGAARGQGSLVRLEARSGDGKSRILDEAALGAEQRGHRVFRTEAHELEAPRPFAMLERLAASILDAAAEDEAYAAALANALASWSPELRTVLPSLHRFLADDEEIERPAVERRFQGALAALFDALGTRNRPAVLLLDDCQWADDLSLGVVSRWSSSSRDGSRFVTVVAAIRREEVDEDHPSRRWTKATTITLPPLDLDETRDLVSSMGGWFPDQAHAVIAQLSQGRPFFITSVIRGMVESEALRPGPGGWLLDPAALATLVSPGKAATFITRRLRRLPEDTLGFLSAAAILGRHASTEECASLANVERDLVNPIVEEARRAGLIWATERDGFSFIHDKVREGALRRLDEEQRRTLHLRAGELIERTRAGDVFDLAYHFDEAGAPDRAQPAALEAASLAHTRRALDSSETMLRIAARGTPKADVSTRARVAEDLGATLMVRGAYEESARWLDEARSLVPPGERAAEIESKIGELAFKRGDVRTGAASIERAIRMIGGRVPRRAMVLLPMLLGELLVQTLHSVWPAVFVGRRPLEDGANDLLASRFYGRLGYAWWFERGKVATLWTHFRSLNLAERYPPTAELAQAYSEHAPAMMLVPWHRRGLRYAQRSHAIRVQLGDLWGQGQSLHFWGAGLYAASEYEASLLRMCESLELLEQTGDRWELNNCRLQIAMARYRLGDLAGAVEDSGAARQAGLESGDAQARGIGLEGWAKATDGLVPERLIRAELERSSEDVLTIASVMQAEGVRLLGIGDPWAAVEAFEESQRSFRRAGMKNAGVGPVRPWLLTALLRAAEVTPAADRRRRAVLLRRARSVARQANRRARFYRNDLPHVLRERARLAALMGRPRRARALFSRSIDVATAQRAHGETLRTRISRGEAGATFGWTAFVDDGERAATELRALIAAAARVPMAEGATSDGLGAPDDGSLSRVPERTTGAAGETDAPVDGRSIRVPTP